MQLLAQLEKRGLVENPCEAVGHLVAGGDECSVFFEAPAWSACSTAAELPMSNTVAPPLSLVPKASSRWPSKLRKNVFRLAATQLAAVSVRQEIGGNYEESRAPINRVVGKHAEVRDVGV
eukprot:198928-Pleurochrysis_carterae.AAC.1